MDRRSNVMSLWRSTASWWRLTERRFLLSTDNIRGSQCVQQSARYWAAVHGVTDTLSLYCTGNAGLTRILAFFSSAKTRDDVQRHQSNSAQLVLLLMGCSGAKTGLTMNTSWLVLGLIHLCMQLVSAIRDNDVIRLGYLTGSQRLPRDLLYGMPGKSISGAISLAVDEINSNQEVMHSACVSAVSFVQLVL